MERLMYNLFAHWAESNIYIYIRQLLVEYTNILCKKRLQIVETICLLKKTTLIAFSVGFRNTPTVFPVEEYDSPPKEVF